MFPCWMEEVKGDKAGTFQECLLSQQSERNNIQADAVGQRQMALQGVCQAGQSISCLDLYPRDTYIHQGVVTCMH